MSGIIILQLWIFKYLTFHGNWYTPSQPEPLKLMMFPTCHLVGDGFVFLKDQPCPFVLFKTCFAPPWKMSYQEFIAFHIELMVNPNRFGLVNLVSNTFCQTRTDKSTGWCQHVSLFPSRILEGLDAHVWYFTNHRTSPKNITSPRPPKKNSRLDIQNPIKSWKPEVFQTIFRIMSTSFLKCTCAIQPTLPIFIAGIWHISSRQTIRFAHPVLCTRSQPSQPHLVDG